MEQYSGTTAKAPFTPPAPPAVMKVQAVTHKRAYLQIVEQVLDLIHRGDLSPGHRLPAEREMAELFSTSRPTVREAMSALELAGVVEVQVGKGVFVLGSGNSPAPILTRLGDEAAPSDLLEVREILEPHAAALAAARASEIEVQAIAEALVGCRTAATGGDASDFELFDDRFHRAVGEGATNPILAQLSEEVSALRSGSLWSLMKRRGALEEGHLSGYADEHEAILAAIRSGDPAAAADAARTHLASVRRFLLGDQADTNSPAASDTFPGARQQ
jgi:DNA-binding FadR family transcriptional regulator